MTHDIVMPQLGITMTEGFVMQWLKAAGDSIEKGEPLFVVQTDKVDMEVESPAKGFVTHLLVQEQVVVPVGTVIARVGESMLAGAAGPAKPTMDLPAPNPRRSGPLVSPRARKVALELGVELAGIRGSGEYGRICEADVRAAFAKRPMESPPAPSPSTDRSAASAARRIAERMEQSVTTIPQFSLRREVDAGPLTLLRDQLLPVVEARDGVRLSFTDFLLKAMAVALRETPGMNAAWREDYIEPRTAINIGFALQNPSRLLVPVIAGADQLSIAQLARRRSELTARGKDGKLGPEDLRSASCTLSNLGSFGVDEFQAIVNPPESCILAAGRIAPRPFVRNGELVIRPTLRLTLTVDHRVAGGVLAAAFLDAIAKELEQPFRLVV